MYYSDNKLRYVPFRSVNTRARTFLFLLFGAIHESTINSGRNPTYLLLCTHYTYCSTSTCDVYRMWDMKRKQGIRENRPAAGSRQQCTAVHELYVHGFSTSNPYEEAVRILLYELYYMSA